MGREVKRVFELLQATSSTTEKERILQENRWNRLLGNTLRFLFNPKIVTGISSKKIKKKVELPEFHKLNSMLEVMQYLKVYNTGSDSVIANVQDFILRQPEDMREFYRGVFTKSIKLGCAAATINKVYGDGFIPGFEVMLAEKYAECKKKVEGKDFSLTLKLDGIRCIIVKENEKVLLYSRQGQPIFGLTEIEQEVEKNECNDCVLDGELLVTKTDGLTSKEQYKATTKIVRKDGEKKGVTFRAFDFLSADEFRTKQCDVSYTTRRHYLEKNFGGCKFIQILPVLYSGRDMAKIEELLEKVRNDGQEGLMLNLNDGVYEFKRTASLLKVKVMQDCDLEITGYEEGRGSLKGTLGRINVDYKGNTLGVGSGFKDEERAYIWANRESLLGRVIKVQYFEETQDANGKLSLRFPVFLEIREAGKKVSYS